MGGGRGLVGWLKCRMVKLRIDSWGGNRHSIVDIVIIVVGGIDTM